MTTTLPTNIAYGKVVGRFLYADADGADGDLNPDGIAAVGTVTFAPNVGRVSNPLADPPVTIFPKTVTATIDSDGYIRDPQNQPGVWLIATDNEDLNPHDWTYRVTVTLQGIKTPTLFDISVPQGQTVDLAVATPVVASNGLTYIIGPPGDAGPEGPVGPAGGVTSVNGQTGDVTVTLGYPGLPAGSAVVVAKSGGVWPSRPTSRTDVVVFWKGADPSPSIVSSGVGGMLDGVDVRLVTP